ncbi:MAG: hypothetical protein JSS72_11245 [Armatimonadetes bacterium]|nr:hypothetical protein [Armatimonadota bacterium]
MVDTKAEISSIAPFFIVRDLQETVAFYRDCLGYEVGYSAPEEKPFFAILRRDVVQVFLKQIAEDVPPVPNSERHEWARWDAFAHTEDPDGLAAEFNRLAKREIAVVKDTEDGLRGFEVIDPNGYVLFFGKPKGI